jgi:hypothetical protein
MEKSVLKTGKTSKSLPVFCVQAPSSYPAAPITTFEIHKPGQNFIKFRLVEGGPVLGILK